MLLKQPYPVGQRMMEKRVVNDVIHIHIHIHNNDNSNVVEVMEEMSGSFDELKAEVAQQTTVVDGVSALVDALIANQNNPAELKAIVQEMAANRQELSDAILRGTPAATVEPPVTTEEQPV